MPSCEGPPSGTCQNKSKQKVVKFGQGELWLCKECEEIRFDHLKGGFTRRVSTRYPKKSSARRKLTNPTASESNRRCLRNTRSSNAEIAQNLLLESTEVPLASIVNPASPVLAPPKHIAEFRTLVDADNTVNESPKNTAQSSPMYYLMVMPL